MSAFQTFTGKMPASGIFFSCLLALLPVVLSVSACSAPEIPAAAGRVDASPLPPARASRPNVVWIVLDACRARNLSCYGNPHETTPTLDALAADGVLFEQAYAQSNWTARSVPSFITGRYFPVSCLDLGGRVTELRIPPPGEKLLPSIMRENGYFAELVSAHALFIRPGSPFWQAFDEAHAIPKPTGPGPRRGLEQINARLIPWVNSAPKQPFFAYVHALDTHFPHDDMPPYNRWADPAYDRGQLRSEGDNQVWRRRDGQPYAPADVAYFGALLDGSLRYVDEQIKVLLDAFKEAGLYDNTIFIIGSDHGDALGEDGQTFEHVRGGSSDQVFHVPLIMAGPGLPRGVRISQLVENVDVVPTLIELLALETDAQPHGKSLLPVMHNPGGGPVHDYVFAYYIGAVCGFPPPYDNEPAVFARDMRFKYECDPTVQQEHLWKTPDDLSARADVLAQNRAEAEKMRSWVQSERLPLRQAYLELPTRGRLYEGFSIVGGAPAEQACVWWGEEDNAEQQSDQKWTIKDRYLWAAGWNETPPPLVLCLPLPNGRYEVAVTTLSCADLLGHPASSIRLTLEGRAPTVLTIATLPKDAGAFQQVELGEVEVQDGRLDLSVEKGLDGYWMSIGKILVTPAGAGHAADIPAPRESVKDAKETEEALRALGYL